MRLLADAMLGTLTRWLRTLGYDTLYDPDLSDHELVRLARAEDRVLLTRDRELIRRRNVKILFITSEQWEEQVRQVLIQLPLPEPAPFSRCLVCNESLVPIPRSEAWGLVPPYVFVTHEQFSLCPQCNQVFWRGTHWNNMEETVTTLCQAWREDSVSRCVGQVKMFVGVS